MSVRLFVGYFLVLAACAVLAFAPSQAGSSTPPATADAGIAQRYIYGTPAASSSVHSRKTTPKRSQIAEAE